MKIDDMQKSAGVWKMEGIQKIGGVWIDTKTKRVYIKEKDAIKASIAQLH